MKKRNIKTAIIKYCRRSGKESFTRGELYGVLGLHSGEKGMLSSAVGSLIRDRFFRTDGDRLLLVPKDKTFTAVITRSHGTFAFAENEEGEEFFIPGKYLMDALPGDRAKLRSIEGEGERRTCAVERVTAYTDKSFIGEAVCGKDGIYVLCREIGPDPIPLKSRYTVATGDKVLFRIISRKKGRFTGMAEGNFGECRRASDAAKIYLAREGIKAEFPHSVTGEAEEVSKEPLSAEGRADLRDKPIFTIDSEYSKDLDDAVYCEKTSDGYRLFVCIADVSHYVKAGGELDREAYRRGTSIYYADNVIPMLPRELSNGICSLNPGEDRYCFTCEAHLSASGEIKSYKFYPAIMRSRVKGVYKEINMILGGTEPEEIRDKYRDVLGNIGVLRELYEKLSADRTRRGVVDFDTEESGFLLDDGGNVIGIYPRERGISECIIEELMIVANRCAGMFSEDKGIPFIYRVHDRPDEEKLDDLAGLLDMLSVPHGKISGGSTEWQKILTYCAGKEIAPIVENRLLRAMAKAKYSSENIGHFGLALPVYSHFTSPIRRYPDLSIHRIMKAVLSGEDGARFCEFAVSSAEQSTERERVAVETERDMDDRYAAEYAAHHIGTEAVGIISGMTNSGIYVLLDNTLEGFVRIEGTCEAVKNIRLRVKGSGKEYRIGEKIAVKIVSADVFTGKIDFSFCE